MANGDLFHPLDVMARHNVPFVVIGAHAVSFHGYLRATEDIDVVIRRSPACESSLLAALTELNACWIGREIDPATQLERLHPVDATYIRSTRLMMLVIDGGFLDIFDFIPGLPDESIDELFRTSIEKNGRRFASLEWLRRMKRASGREKDLRDLENLPKET